VKWIIAPKFPHLADSARIGGRMGNLELLIPWKPRVRGFYRLG
jgi:hypothetical protein